MYSNFIVVEGSINLPPSLKNAVVAIGNFDGIHKGHQYLLQKALDLAKQLNCMTIVLTFEPHPVTLKNKDITYHRIITSAEKDNILNKLGFNGVVKQKFDHNFMNIAPEEFIEKILIKELQAKAIIVGSDFCFGKHRSGNIHLLKKYSPEYFLLYAVDVQKNKNLHDISSSYIRKLLLKGDVSEVAKLLGYHYYIENIVLHGAKLGRKIGFPTVNMKLAKNQNLAFGIYAVKIKRLNGKIYDGVASFGKRPTIVEEGEPLLETHIFDFDEEIYGEYLQISLFNFLRSEEKFKNLDLLIKQISKDVKQAKYLLQTQKPLSNLDQKLCFQ